MCLNISDPDIHPVINQIMCFLEHPVRFAYTGNHTDINLKLATTGFFYQVEEMLYTFFSIHLFFNFYTA